MELEKKNNSENCPQLTEDVLFEEILPRLEVESLIRFKLVSKRWLHLITTDSRFIRNQFGRQSQTPAELSIILPCDSDNMYIFDHRSGTARARDVSSSCADRFHGSYSSLEVAGSCNGLVCVALRNDNSQQDDLEASVLLWNPRTGEARDTLLPPLSDDLHLGYGFGYDETHDNYKVVRAALYDCNSRRVTFDVFSRNSGVWRRLEREFVGHKFGDTGIFVNGCLYWPLTYTKPYRILSFDLRDDEFRVVDLGISFECCSLHRKQLVKWKRNCLAYVISPVNAPDVKFKIVVVLDGDGNAPVINGADTRSEDLLYFGPRFCYWHGFGVSHGRLFLEIFREFYIYDSVSCSGDQDICGRRSLCTADWDRKGRGSSQFQDYAPSLVSVYPDRNMTIMMEDGR